jgi:hypothetical protein
VFPDHDLWANSYTLVTFDADPGRPRAQKQALLKVPPTLFLFCFCFSILIKVIVFLVYIPVLTFGRCAAAGFLDGG